MDRCVPFQIMANQLNLPQLDSNQVLETSEGWWRQDAPELNFECHSQRSENFVNVMFQFFIFNKCAKILENLAALSIERFSLNQSALQSRGEPPPPLSSFNGSHFVAERSPHISWGGEGEGQEVLPVIHQRGERPCIKSLVPLRAGGEQCGKTRPKTIDLVPSAAPESFCSLSLSSPDTDLLWHFTGRPFLSSVTVFPASWHNPRSA